eukprot:144177-Amphidinium_carterae.3
MYAVSSETMCTISPRLGSRLCFVRRPAAVHTLKRATSPPNQRGCVACLVEVRVSLSFEKGCPEKVVTEGHRYYTSNDCKTYFYFDCRVIDMHTAEWKGSSWSRSITQRKAWLARVSSCAKITPRKRGHLPCSKARAAKGPLYKSEKQEAD